jgi:hypothetical protein
LVWVQLVGMSIDISMMMMTITTMVAVCDVNHG